MVHFAEAKMTPSDTQERANEVPTNRVQSELERIVCSAALQHSPQLQRFLRFIVEETLAGRGARLKEYVVGLEVFGRPPGYDPRLDSLVRVEAKRLRDALEEYYAGEGNADEVRIDFQRGCYTPSFRLAPAATSETAPQPAKLRRSIYLWGSIGIAVLAVVAVAVTAGILRRQMPATATIHTVAVLPFENLSSDPENEYLCFGLMDEITTELAKNERLRVIARTSSSRFTRKDNVASIAHQLRADAIVEGSVSRSGNQIRITAQLINATDSLHVWAQTYERQTSDPLQVQNEVSRAVARGVAMRLGLSTGENVITPRYSTSPVANELYWKGAYLRTPRGKEHWREDLEKSAQFLEQAVQRDNRFAPAFAALSDVYMNLAFESNGGPITSNYVSRSRNAATRAIDLDSSSSEAYCSLGVIQAFYDWDWAAAEKSFVRSLELNPSNAAARSWYALTLLPQRRFDEATDQARKSTELDPLSFQVNNALGVSYYLARNNKQAMQCAQRTIQIDPRFAAAYALMGMALEQEQKYDLAIAEYEKGLRLAPDHSFLLGRLGHAYAMAGRRTEAMKVLNQMFARHDAANVSDLHIAYAYAGLGDANALFEQLDRAYRKRDPDLPYFNADPILDSFRNDPRFAEMLRKIGLSG
jgi:TolB-like protein/Flp pilus assembly protein TadD